MLRGWPDMPVGIEDRDADVWEALLAVADPAGGEWPEIARAAALALVADPDGKRPSLGVRLLADLLGVYQRLGMLAPGAPAESGLPSELLVDALVTLEEAPWATIAKGEPLNRAGLARRLRRYGVTPGQLWYKGTNQRGYKTGDLLDPWSRYVTDISGPSFSENARGARPLGCARHSRVSTSALAVLALPRERCRRTTPAHRKNTHSEARVLPPLSFLRGRSTCLAASTRKGHEAAATTDSSPAR